MRNPSVGGVAGWFLAASIAAAPLSLADRDADLAKWIDGPVRYLALKEEVQAFRQLETDPQRALFIEKFWSRRDPSPETMVNEYRQLFWERVQQANESFLDSTKPGWMTDRGKIHILYGPPTEVDEDPHLAVPSDRTTGHGVIRWIYEGRPSQRMDLDPIVVVPFVRDSSGEYRVSYDPKLSSVFFDAAAIREDRDRQVNRYLDLIGAQPFSSLSVMLDLGRMQEVPPQEQVLLERVETMESYQTHEVPARVDRYLHPDRGEPLLVITVDLADTAPGEKPAIIARLTHYDATRQPRLLGEDSFRLLEEGGVRVAQGRLVVEPGSYNLTLMVADPVKVRTGLFRTTIQVPPVDDRFRSSDLVWASTLRSLSFGSLASHDEPYHIGPFFVVPKLDPRYATGETIKLFFEVYGGSYPLHVSYQLQGKEDSGAWVDLGQPSVGEQNAAALAWELPTTNRWPPGDYRVHVEVQDQEGRLITRDAPFTLIAEPPS